MEETESAKMSRPSKELHRAVKAGRVSVLKMLLWAPGARVDAADGSKRTALHYACKSGHKNAERVVDMLLRAGAAINAQDESGITPLHEACKSDHEDAERIVDMLLRAEAVVNVRDKSGKTPLHEACTKMKIRYCRTEPSVNEKRQIEMSVIKHVLKQRSLNILEEFRNERRWRMGDNFRNEIKDRAYHELQVMKSTEIVKDVSLYSVLSHTNQPYNLELGDVHKIGKIITSPCVKKQFPLYYRSLVTTFDRSMLLTWAVHSFYSECRKMKVFPYLVAEQLLALLSNEDLKSFLRSDIKK